MTFCVIFLYEEKICDLLLGKGLNFELYTLSESIRQAVARLWHRKEKISGRSKNSHFFLVKISLKSSKCREKLFYPSIDFVINSDFVYI